MWAIRRRWRERPLYNTGESLSVERGDMRSRFLGIAIALLSVLLATACGGGDDDEGADPTATNDSAALLESMALTAGDLLPDLEQASTSLSTNEDLAEAAVNPEGEAARLKRLGRILGYEVQFAPVADAPSGFAVQGAQNSVSLFEAASGATESLADGLAKARSTDWAALNADLRDVSVNELPVPEEANEGAWFRIIGTDDGGNVVIDDEVAFRVENVRAYLRVVLLLPAGTPADAQQEQTQQWTALSAQRIREALEADAS